MNILVFNCGSSSLKYQLLAMPEAQPRAVGEAQRIGPPTAKPSQLVTRNQGVEQIVTVPMANHGAAFQQVMHLLSRDPACTPDAVAHRLVNGGPTLPDACRLDPTILTLLEKAAHLAPIHNPPALATIKACRQHFPTLPQVIVSDTAFHRTIPDYARTYAIPPHLSTDMGFRKYGFHGISHAYVMREAARFMEIPLPDFHAVSCHLGSGGASLCAIRHGRSIDNTMGYSPLQGLVMSTRCGDIDPGLALNLLSRSKEDGEALSRLLNTKSGVLGLSGRSADIRDALEIAHADHSDTDAARSAVEVYLWRLKKYLGAYLTLVQQPRAVIFTDTIGETVPAVRQSVCSNMENFGIILDHKKNQLGAPLPVDIATSHSRVRLLVIHTNEELAIAQAAFHTLSNPQPAPVTS